MSTSTSRRTIAAKAGYERWRMMQPQQELLLDADRMFTEEPIVFQHWTEITDAAIDAYIEDGEVQKMAKEIYDTMIKGRPFLPTLPFEQLMEDDAWRTHLTASARRILGKE
jgi:hypothetical protein